jgi:hypothetical protein
MGARFAGQCGRFWLAKRAIFQQQSGALFWRQPLLRTAARHFALVQQPRLLAAALLHAAVALLLRSPARLLGAISFVLGPATQLLSALSLVLGSIALLLSAEPELLRTEPQFRRGWFPWRRERQPSRRRWREQQPSRRRRQFVFTHSSLEADFNAKARSAQTERAFPVELMNDSSLPARNNSLPPRVFDY